MDPILLIIAKSLLLFFVAIFIHEAGHLIAGICLKWQFYHISFGPFKVSYSQVKGLRLSWIKAINGWGGAVAILPKSPDAVNGRDVGLVVAAGPALSFLGALVFFGTEPVLTYISLAIAILTALPYRVGNVYSDGGKLRRLLEGYESSELELSGFRIGASVLHHGTFANVDEKDIQGLMSSPDIKDHYRGLYYSWCFYRDTANIQMAQLAKADLDEISRELPISLRKKLEAYH